MNKKLAKEIRLKARDVVLMYHEPCHTSYMRESKELLKLLQGQTDYVAIGAILHGVEDGIAVLSEPQNKWRKQRMKLQLQPDMTDPVRPPL